MAISLRRTQMRNAARPRTGCVIERRCRRSEAVLGRWALSCVECWRAATASELVFRPDLSVMTTTSLLTGRALAILRCPDQSAGTGVRPKAISLEVVLASACLPRLHDAVDIYGEPHWDGGYAANPPLIIIPLVGASRIPDVLLVQLIPTDHSGVPVDQIGRLTSGSVRSR